MSKSTTLQNKIKDWVLRYIFAESTGTVIALVFAGVSFAHSHSYLVATAAGLIGEGIGFYGFFSITELVKHGNAYHDLPWHRRIVKAIAKSGTNLLLEFAPAEIFDSFLLRPILFYTVPQHIKPYAVGFIAAKLLSDFVFYSLAITAYEVRKKFGKPTG